jgi:hypothetical protein
VSNAANDDDGDELEAGGEARGLELHPLFVEAEETAIAEGRAPLAQPVETIDVWRFHGSHGGKPSFVSWHYAQDLPDEGALLELHGPGWYELRARNAARNKILRKASLRVGAGPPSPTYGGPHNAAPAAAPPAPPAPPAPAHGGGMEGSLLALLVSEMRASRESTTQMMLAFAAASREGAGDMVRAVSSLAQSRVADQQGLINALTAVQGQSGGGVEAGAELYEKVLAQAMALSETMRAGRGGASDGQELEMLNAFVDGIRTLKQDPPTAEQLAAAHAAQAAQNGKGGPH